MKKIFSLLSPIITGFSTACRYDNSNTAPFFCKKKIFISIVSIFSMFPLAYTTSANAYKQETVYATLSKKYPPKWTPKHPFPVVLQTRNSCYFSSLRIIMEAKYKQTISGKQLKEMLKKIKFDGSRIADNNDTLKFHKLIGISIQTYSQRESLIKELSAGNPVLVSTKVPLANSKESVLHVSVAYSWDDQGIWVSDSLYAKRRRIPWDSVFGANGKVKYNKLRVVEKIL